MAEKTLAHEIFEVIERHDPDARDMLDYEAARRTLALKWDGHAIIGEDLTIKYSLRPEAYDADGNMVGEYQGSEVDWLHMPIKFSEIVESADYRGVESAYAIFAAMRAEIDRVEANLRGRWPEGDNA